MTALEIANYLIYILNGAVDDLTNSKLNLLLYFAQGHYLQEYSEILFDDEVEAWEEGPIIPEVYSFYEPCGKESITEHDRDVAKNLPSDTKAFLFNLARAYYRFDAEELREMACEPDSPWSEIAGKSMYEEIPIDLIAAHFATKDPVVLMVRQRQFSDDELTNCESDDSEDTLTESDEWED